MEQQEKVLIESLFSRLENVEKESSIRDIAAEKLIRDLLIKQHNAPYYMTQIVLVQEEAIKKLNERISQLETELSLMQEKEKKKSTSSFLSGLFGSNNTIPSSENIKNTWGSTPGKKDHLSLPVGTVPTGNIGTSSSSGNISSFLGSALQTATGVAGGMVMGNMLMNLFQHKSSGEDFFNNVNHAPTSNSDADLENNNSHNHYINQNDSNSHENVDHDNTVSYDDNIDTDIDVSDDSNFI